MWSAALSPQGLLYVNKMAAFQVLTDVTASGGVDELREAMIRSNSQKVPVPKPTPSSPITGALMVLLIQCSFVAIFRTLSLRAAEKKLRGAQ